MHINAGWEETTKGKAICRYLVAWQSVSTTQVAGAVAGYAGGGSFVVERFVGTLKGDTFVALWIDYTDRVSGKEIEFDSCGKKALAMCESGLDMVWEWNDNDVWSDTDEVVLRSDKAGELLRKKEMRYLASDTAPWVRTVCAKAGLTGAPTA